MQFLKAISCYLKHKMKASFANKEQKITYWMNKVLEQSSMLSRKNCFRDIYN